MTMKVILINGSPRPNGCTYTALNEVTSELNKNGIDTEIIHVGNKTIQGCLACGHCRSHDNRCIVEDGIVNDLLDKASQADGFIFGSPVYYGSANGTLISLLDRAFMAGGKHFRHKPGAVVVSARRAGTTSTYDQLNKYIGLSNMIMVPSQFWNMVHGNTPEEVLRDEEGLQTMRTLGRNMAWLLKLLELGRQNGLTIPEGEKHVSTNFIR